MALRTSLCDRLGIEHPIVGFTPSEHVAAAISRAGGLGVLGCVRYNDADELEAALTWMDANTDGRPYGVDVVMPAKVPAEGTQIDLGQLIPASHKEFVDQTLLRLGVPPLAADEDQRDGVLGWLHSVARAHVEVALHHPVALIANALGSPPDDVIDSRARPRHRGRRAGRQGRARRQTCVARRRHRGRAGLRSRRAHRRDRQHGAGARDRRRGRARRAGARGRRHRLGPADRRRARARRGRRLDGLVLADHAGVRDRDPGAAGLRDALLAATSSDTVRSRIYSGKPARLLKNEWTKAWEEPGAPEPLPMPLQNLLVSEAHQRLMESGDPAVVPMPVGQIVGRMNTVRPVAEVMASLLAEADEALTRLGKLR